MGSSSYFPHDGDPPIPDIWWFTCNHQLGEGIDYSLPHWSGLLVSGDKKRFLQASRLCLSPTSIESTIGWLTDFLKMHFFSHKEKVVIRNFMRIIWSLRIFFSSFELGWGIIYPLYSCYWWIEWSLLECCSEPFGTRLMWMSRQSSYNDETVFWWDLFLLLLCLSPGWKLWWVAMLCDPMMGWMYWWPLILMRITRTCFFLLEKNN